MDAGLYRKLRGLATVVAFDLHDVDDLTQEAAIRLDRVGLTQWNGLAIVVAKRAMIDWQRQRFGRPWSARSQAKWQTWPVDDFAEVLGDHDPALDRAEARAVVEALPWRRLSDRDLLAWERRAAGATLREIGDELGVTDSRVCQILSRTRRRLLE